MAKERLVWDRFASTYDLVVRLYDRSYPIVRELLADDLAGRHHVLELGAGTGQFTMDIAAVVDELVATDLSPKMVERLATLVPSNVQARVMSAYDIDAADGHFDAVFCANALHVMETPEVALRECLRVLKDEGLLIVPTFLHGVGPARRSLSRLLSLVSPFVAHTRFDLAALEKIVGRCRFPHRQERAAPWRVPHWLRRCTAAELTTPALLLLVACVVGERIIVVLR